MTIRGSERPPLDFFVKYLEISTEEYQVDRQRFGGEKDEFDLFLR